MEPLWADLRERQRLTRFHRRGLAKVKLEFALHCAAYNLRKVAVGAGLALLFTLSIRSAHRRQLVAIGWIIFPSRFCIGVPTVGNGPQNHKPLDREGVGVRGE